MTKKCGRPPKAAEPIDAKQKLIDTTVDLVKRYGADSITVRSVCEEAGLSIGTFYHYFQNKDSLLMHFVREASFDRFVLETPITDIAGRVCELYMHLIDRYLDLGEEFMKSFYTTGNTALSAYMGQADGCFAEGTVMARCEQELTDAQRQGILNKAVDVHTVSMDICTIVKGCVFEWALNNGEMDIESVLRRIIGNYLSVASSAHGV
ncbi:MAG: TetR/AcrR family transcriptional regulator [Oscillospiraceae bacterium]|nr:TetR/AcrR family transcriptional regulator [Oscillospiraceae bacterium]